MYQPPIPQLRNKRREDYSDSQRYLAMFALTGDLCKSVTIEFHPSLS